MALLPCKFHVTVDVCRRIGPGHEVDLLVERYPFLDDDIGVNEFKGTIYREVFSLLGGVRRFRLGWIPGCCVTLIEPHKVSQLIARGKITLDETVVLHRVAPRFWVKKLLHEGLRRLKRATCRFSRLDPRSRVQSQNAPLQAEV